MSEITIPTSWITLFGVHDKDVHCDSGCVVHSPTDHHMRFWTLHWRSDRGLFERICPHGVGHPDPDQFDYWERTHQPFQAIHGCCVGNCCRPIADSHAA